MKKFRPFFLTLFIFALTIMPVLAQEEAVTSTEGNPSGLIWLFFGGGLFAIIVIGGILFARENADDAEGKPHERK